MNAWNTYQDRLDVRGDSKRTTALQRESHYINQKVKDSLSFQTVTIRDGEHGYNIDSAEMAGFAFQQDVAIINSDNLNEKLIISLPGQDIVHGSLVRWMDNYWLVTERDANSTIYVKAKMIQCNHLLQWVSDDGVLCKQWCIVEDGTKYLTGEMEDRHFVVTRGDSRIAVTIARNSKTVRLGRKNRFLIDDPASPQKLSYALTKPLKLGWSFNNMGAFKFVLQEVNSTEDDNQELGIADYYKYFPRTSEAGETESSEPSPSEGKKRWL